MRTDSSFKFFRPVFFIAALAVLGASVPARAQEQKPDVEVDMGALDDMPKTHHADSALPAVQLAKPAGTFSGPVMIQPGTSPDTAVPAESAVAAKVPPPEPVPASAIWSPAALPAPVASSHLPPPPEASVPVPQRKPKTEEASPDIQHFPITQKIQSDTLNPSAPQSEVAPSPDVAALLAAAPAPQPPPPKAVPPAPDAAKPVHKTAAVVKLPPLPARHPAPSPATAVTRTAATKMVILSPRKPVAPAMPVAAAVPVTTVPLKDPLAQKLATPDKKQMVQDIEDISAAVVGKTAQPGKNSGQIPDLTAKIAPASAPEAPVPDLTASPAPPPAAEKQAVPRPPPQDPREINYFTIPFKPGADQLDSQVTATLQSQVLPLLKDHPAWRLQIQAFASASDKEPISARRVSLARALAVRAWLLDKGVEARRMDLRALGLETDREPTDRVDMVFLDPNGG